jgi:hypothetical protein
MAPAAIADAGFSFLSGIEVYTDVSAFSSLMAMCEWFW